MYAQISSSAGVSTILVLAVLIGLFMWYDWRKTKIRNAESNCRYLILQACAQLRETPNAREFRIQYDPEMKLDHWSRTYTEGILRWNKWIIYFYKEHVYLRPVKPLDGAPKDHEPVYENHKIWLPSAYINGVQPEFDSFEHLDKLTVGN